MLMRININIAIFARWQAEQKISTAQLEELVIALPPPLGVRMDNGATQVRAHSKVGWPHSLALAHAQTLSLSPPPLSLSLLHAQAVTGCGRCSRTYAPLLLCSSTLLLYSAHLSCSSTLLLYSDPLLCSSTLLLYSDPRGSHPIASTNITLNPHNPPPSILHPPLSTLHPQQVGLLRVIKDLDIPIESGGRISYHETFKACVRRVLADADEMEVNPQP